MSRDAGCLTYVSTRKALRAKGLEKKGFRPVIADWNDPRTLSQSRFSGGLPDIDQMLVAVSHDRNGGFSRFESQVGGLRRLLEVTRPHVDICYISTTGVYHQTDGRWVDERSPTFPTREGGKAHLYAESILHRIRPRSPWTILRLAGIYGPGRVPRIVNVVDQKPIASRSSGFLNLIHVEDAARAVLATWESPSQRMYVVSDDVPVVRADFYREIARQCRVAEPNFIEPDPRSLRGARSESNKRVWNRRMRGDLIDHLKYPQLPRRSGGCPTHIITFPRTIDVGYVLAKKNIEYGT